MRGIGGLCYTYFLYSLHSAYVTTYVLILSKLPLAYPFLRAYAF